MKLSTGLEIQHYMASDDPCSMQNPSKPNGPLVYPAAEAFHTNFKEEDRISYQHRGTTIYTYTKTVPLANREPLIK